MFRTDLEEQMARAIKARCLDCSGGYKKEVEECIIADCPLYPYRLGKPKRDSADS